MKGLCDNLDTANAGDDRIRVKIDSMEYPIR